MVLKMATQNHNCMMSITSYEGQNRITSWAGLFSESSLDQLLTSNEDGLDVAVSEECFEKPRGVALVDSVCPQFGTAIFNCAGRKEKLFFYKNKVFVDGKKVTNKTLLTDILKCDMVVAFEAEPYSSENYDARFRATKVSVPYIDVSEDELSPAFVNCSNTCVDSLLLKSGCTDIASMQALKNHCAQVKHVSNLGGVLDYTPEVTFHWSVVLITEYFEGQKSLRNLIPVGTKVNFDAVVTNSGIKATSLWVGLKPKNISFKKCEGATDSDGLMKKWCGIVESYTSAKQGTIGGFKIKGQKMVAVFDRKNVYFPEPTEMALQDYLPVGALVHFDGKLVTSKNLMFVKVSLVWCQKRSTNIMEEALCEQPQSIGSLDTVSSREWPTSSVCTGVTGTSEAHALSISRNGTVSRYISKDTGIINCSVFGKESEVLFDRSNVCFPSKKDRNKSLTVYLPVGSHVIFTAEMFTFSGQIVVKSLWLIQEHTNSALPSMTNERSASASPVQTMSVPNTCSAEPVNENSYLEEVSKSSQNTKEILFGRCGYIKYYNSQFEGVIECTINDGVRNILFTKGSLLLEPQLYAKNLKEAFPVGTVVNFDAKIEMLGDCSQYVATAMWVKKKPKPSTNAPIATALSNSSIVSLTNTKVFLHNRASQIKCFISDDKGIVAFPFNGTIKETFFHRNVVYIPYDVTVPLEDYLTVGRNVFFDGWFEEGSSDRIIVTSLWAEKKKKVQSPNNVAEVQTRGNKVDQEFSDSGTSCLVSDCGKYSNEDSNTERYVSEDAAVSGDWEMPCPVSSCVRGLTAKVLAYTSKHTGIIQCTIFKKNVTTTFHRSVVYIPDKVKDLTLEEYLPVGKSVYFDGDVTIDEHDESMQPILTVTLLWGGKKPKPHLSESPVKLTESPVKLTINSIKLSQSKVYEAEVVELDKFFFTASILHDGSKIPVLVWNQYFRPSVTCEEPLKKGEPVNLHVCIGDKVFLQVQSYDGKRKDKFEWCAYDAWKDSRVTWKERASICSRNDRADGDGTVMWLDEVSAFLQVRTSGIEVSFQRRNAILFGISLAEFDLTKIFRIGDSLSYILDNEFEASKVWFGSCSIEGTVSGFLKVKEFCLDRCIHSDITHALVKQLARQSSKGSASNRTSQGMGEQLPAAVSYNQKFAKETEDTDEDCEYIYVSSSASTDDDSESDNISNEDGPSTMVDLHLTKHNLSPMLMDPLLTRDRPTSSLAEGMQPVEDELVSPLVMAVHPTKDQQTHSAEELQLTEDEQTSPIVMNSLSAKDNLTCSLAVYLQPIEDKLMSPVAIHPTKDIPVPVVMDLQQTEDKQNLHSSKTEPPDHPAMDFHVANITVAKDYSQCSEICGSYSSLCAEAADNDSSVAESVSAVNKSVFPVLRSSLEAVLKSKGFEVQLCNELISEVMVLVHKGMGLNWDIPHSELPNWGELVSGSGNGSEVRQSEQAREVHSVESSTQTTSTGHIISLRYLPYV